MMYCELLPELRHKILTLNVLNTIDLHFCIQVCHQWEKDMCSILTKEQSHQWKIYKREIPCDKCTKKTQSRRTRNRPMSIIILKADPPARRYCHVCKYGFVTKRDLCTHFKTYDILENMGYQNIYFGDWPRNDIDIIKYVSTDAFMAKYPDYFIGVYYILDSDIGNNNHHNNSIRNGRVHNQDYDMAKFPDVDYFRIYSSIMKYSSFEDTKRVKGFYDSDFILENLEDIIDNNKDYIKILDYALSEGIIIIDDIKEAISDRIECDGDVYSKRTFTCLMKYDSEGMDFIDNLIRYECVMDKYFEYLVEHFKPSLELDSKELCSGELDSKELCSGELGSKERELCFGNKPLYVDIGLWLIKNDFILKAEDIKRATIVMPHNRNNSFESILAFYVLCLEKGFITKKEHKQCMKKHDKGQSFIYVNDTGVYKH